LEGMNLNALSRGAFQALPDAYTPRTRQELAEFLDTLSPTDLILALPALSRESSWLYLAFAQRDLKFVRASLAALPMGRNCRIVFRRSPWRGVICAVSALRHLLYRIKVRLKLIGEIGPAFFRLPAPLLWVRAGTWRQPFADHSFKVNRSEVVSVEGFEVFWAKRATVAPDPRPAEPYAVFIDSALCHHPDFQIENIPVRLDEAAYFASLRTFFEKVERQFDLPVVISLHPKANYNPDEVETLFGRRPVFIGTTPALIKNSALTLQHQSTATVISALYRKPILFLTNDALEATIIKADIESRSSWLDQPRINLDAFMRNPDTAIPVPEVDERIYRAFVEKFAIAPGAHDGPIWEKVADVFEARSPLNTSI